MPDNSTKSQLISDSGVIDNKKILHTKIFVALCRILSLILAIIGMLAFVEGNF
jgi:hypothetical protein